MLSPYLSVLSEKGGRSRDEKRFLLESIPTLIWGGLMVYIVPYYRMTEDICRVFCDNFEQVSIHRFLDGEFKKFKQVAVMGLRQHRTDGSIEAAKLCEAASHLARLPTLDVLEAGRYVLPASSLKVENFRGASSKRSVPPPRRTAPRRDTCSPPSIRRLSPTG